MTHVLRLALLVVSVGSFFSSRIFAARTFASRAEVVRILQTESFQIMRHVDQIPYQDLISAGVIDRGRTLRSALANPGDPFDSSDALVDFSKLGQLIVAGVNKRHEIICFWQATQGGPAAYFMLVRRAERQSRVVFYASLNGHPRKWTDVKALLFEGKISEFTSAEHPNAYKK